MTSQSDIIPVHDHGHTLAMPARLHINIEPLGPFPVAQEVVSRVHTTMRSAQGDIATTMGVFLSLAIEAYSRGEEAEALRWLEHSTYLAQAEAAHVLSKH